MTCISVDDLFLYNCCADTLDCPSEVLEANLEAAEDIVERITGQWLCSRELCFEVWGSGSKNLYFPVSVLAPAITIESVELNGVAVTDYTVHGHYISKCACFLCKKYDICGEFGYETIPPALKRIVILLALEYTQPGITGLINPSGVTRADWTDFSISYKMLQFGRIFWPYHWHS